MKIRTGFVSNSSSSSFVIVGHKTKKPLEAIKEGKKIFVYIEGAGISGEAEDWGMFLDDDGYKMLTESRWFKRREDQAIFFEVSKAIEAGEDEGILKVKEDIEGEEIFAFYRDYSSPDSIEQLNKFLDEVGG